jgi:hypothetical protein
MSSGNDADALAFYRPFHFSPHEEWGSISLWTTPDLLYNSFKGKLATFSSALRRSLTHESSAI